MSPLDQLRQRWENLNKDQNTKLRLSLNSLEHEQLSPVSAAGFSIILDPSFSHWPAASMCCSFSLGVFEFCSSGWFVSMRDFL